VVLPSQERIVVQEQGRAGVEQHEPGTLVGLQWRPEDLRLLP
jgi:TOBE domain